MGLCVSLFHTVFPLKWWQLWACSAIIPRIHTHIDTDRESSQTPTGPPGLPVPVPTIGSIVPVRLQSAVCGEECVFLATVERWGQNLTNWRHFVIGDSKMGSWYPLSSWGTYSLRKEHLFWLFCRASAGWVSWSDMRKKEVFRSKWLTLRLRNVKWVQSFLTSFTEYFIFYLIG